MRPAESHKLEAPEKKFGMLLCTVHPNTDARRTTQIDAKGELTHFKPPVTSALCSPHQLEALDVKKDRYEE